LLDIIPNDLKLGTFMDLKKDSRTSVQQMLNDKHLATSLLRSV